MLDRFVNLLGVSCLRTPAPEPDVDEGDGFVRHISPTPSGPVVQAPGGLLPDVVDKHTEADDGKAFSEATSTQAGSTTGDSADASSFEGRATDPPLAGGDAGVAVNWVCPACEECNKASREQCNSCSRPRYQALGAESTAAADVEPDLSKSAGSSNKAGLSSAAADGGCPGEKLAASMDFELVFPRLANDPTAIVVDVDGNEVVEKEQTSKNKPKSQARKKVKPPKGMTEDENNPGKFRRIKPSELYLLRQIDMEKKKEKNRAMVEAMLEGTAGAPDGQYEKDKAAGVKPASLIPQGLQKVNVQGDMRFTLPSTELRVHTRHMLLEGYRDTYKKMKRSSIDIATDTYTEADAAALGIKDGHKPIPRPEVPPEVPKDFRKMLPKSDPKEEVPTMALTQLTAGYDTTDFKPGKRLLVSVYGDIFDVSDRPDKYGPDGPYWWMTGHDLTWGFVSGSDHPDTVDKMYDYWKVAPEALRDRKLQGVLAWVAWYEWEYGRPVGILTPYVKEAGLKGPPIEDAQECCVM